MSAASEPDAWSAPVADLSVALCTRNGARFVGDQLESILAQSILPREIVVGDDASTDETLSIIESTIERFRVERPRSCPQLRIITRPIALGVTANFDQTIAACTSTFVALCDQDDIWPAGRVERLLPIFDDPTVSLVHTDARLVDGAGSPTGTRLLEALELSPAERAALVSGEAFPVLLRRNLITGATVILRRSLAVSASPFPAAWLHDEWLAIVAATTGSVRLVDETWLDYRQHGQNEVGASAPTWSRRWQRLREPRAPRAARLVARAESLVAYLERSGATGPVLEHAHGKLAHERWRAGLARWPVFRLLPVAAAFLAGRYRRFNRGMIDVLRDLVQPAR